MLDGLTNQKNQFVLSVVSIQRIIPHHNTLRTDRNCVPYVVI